MKPIKIPDNYNYIAAFLTLACNFKCSYCINRVDELVCPDKQLTGDEWITALNRIESRDDLPATLQGGEPSLHPDFVYILQNIKSELNIDILTNLEFNTEDFMKNVKPDRIKRDALYASIRVSYHPGPMELDHLVEKVLKLQNAGYSIGIWGVLHPEQEEEIEMAKEQCRTLGIDFRAKEFLGEYKGEMYGTFKYPSACNNGDEKAVECRTSELIIGPDGGVYRCHGDLYGGRKTIGNILDPEFEIDDRFLSCDYFGLCNPCDVKTKTNRFQQYGHSSVEIRFKAGS